MSAAAPAGKPAGKKSRHQRSDSNSKKHRWTAAERAARGHKPRRRGGADEKSVDRTAAASSGGNRAERRAAERRNNDRRDNWSNDRRDNRSDDRRSTWSDRGNNRSDRGNNRSDRGNNRSDRGNNRPDRGDNRSAGDSRYDDRRSNNRAGRGANWSDRGANWSDDRRNERGVDRRNNRSDDRRASWSDDRRNDRGDDRRNNRSGDRRASWSDDRRNNRSDDRRTSWSDDRPVRQFEERPGRQFEERPGRQFEERPGRQFEDRSGADRQVAKAKPDNRPVAQQEAGITEPADGVGFAELGVAQPLVDRLVADGIVSAFPIQAASIPDAVSGRDVLGRGRTGSGKTLGFGLPLLTRLAAGHRKGRDPRALILLPTRELATQVSDVLNPLARTLGLRTQLVAGGMSYGPQLKGLENGVDVVIGTPGRLIDLMDRGALVLGSIEITVLDEADHMADLGFLPDVTTLLDAVPGNGQRMLFSATLDRGVDRLVQTYLHDPSTHQVDSAQASVDTMQHYLLPIAPADKRSITAEIANRDGRTVIFVRTQLGADRVAEQLRESGVMAGALHGGLPQGARTRTLEAFKTGSLPVLVATDVAARGIHVDEVGLVLQVDPPNDPKTYLHRAGRTARAGQTGVVVTLVLPNQRRQVRRLAKDAGVAAIELNARPGEAALVEATGAVPTNGPGIGEREYAKLIAPRQSNRSGRGPRRGPGRGPGQRDDRRGNRGGRGHADRGWGGKSNDHADRGRGNGSKHREQAAYHSER